MLTTHSTSYCKKSIGKSSSQYINRVAEQKIKVFKLQVLRRILTSVSMDGERDAALNCTYYTMNQRRHPHEIRKVL